MVKAILFDFWGTLVENGIFPSPVRQVMFILRLRMPFKEFIVRFEQVMMTKPYDDLNEAFIAVCKEFNIDPQPFIIEKLVGMWNKNELLGKPFLEAVEMLEFLKQKKFKIGLISNTTSTITRVLEKFDLNKHFDAVLYSYECGLLKTDSDMFKQLCKKLKVKPAEAIMIGDSIPTDIIGARSAGLKAVLIDRRNRRDFNPRIINLRDLKEIIESDALDDFLSNETELNPMAEGE